MIMIIIYIKLFDHINNTFDSE